MAETPCPRVRGQAALAGGILAVWVVASACARTGGPPLCRTASDGGATFVVTSSTGSVSVAQQEDDGLRRLASVGEAQASQGALVFGVDGVDATMIVLGPTEMASVAIRGVSDTSAANCEAPALSVAALSVRRGETVTVDGLDADGDALFSRTERVPEDGSGVIAQVGPPPTT